MDDLVQRLMEEQEVEISLRPERTLDLFKAALDRGYVNVRFTKTRGGTELGVRMDPAACVLAGADWRKGQGKVNLVGGLILNYVRVRCHAGIDLATLNGTGRLEIIEEVTPAQLDKQRARNS